jgi:hypothetical protein
MEIDHLYELLPTVYRLRDAERGYPLQALMRVIAEQAQVVEQDIARLYENWFIETCDDWVVPYIGDLIGWVQVHDAGEPGAVTTAEGRARNKILIPRRDVANTIRSRRRKGTLALLEQLANDVAGWPARAVEFFRLLGRTQNVRLPHPHRGDTIDVRQGAALELIGGPFDRLAHFADVRRINSHRSVGYFDIPSVGLFVCRLKAYPVVQTRAFCVEEASPDCFTFSVLGNNTPLFTKIEPEADPSSIAGELNLPVAIRRRAFEVREVVNGVVRTHVSKHYYGDGKSIAIWTRKPAKDRHAKVELQLVSPARIIPADLSDWSYRPRRDRVAVDPVLGRLAFATGQSPKEGVWVSYHYGFSADMGGGEYNRLLSQPLQYKLYRVGTGGDFRSIHAALRQWENNDAAANPNAVIEIVDSGVYVEQINVTLKGKQSLQLRAANRQRPVIRLLDWHTDKPDSLSVTGESESRFTLDGLLITGRGLMIEGNITEVTIRHSTLVPGWSISTDCEPHRPAEPSLELFAPHACVTIERSIIGSIQVHPLIPREESDVESKPQAKSAAAESGCSGVGHGFRVDPICLKITDSIMDATNPGNEAIGAPGCPVAHARLTIKRCTVFGQIQVHAIDLGENCIFVGKITVARSQEGCLRFCYVTPGSRTPRRYECQPDLVTRGKSGDEKDSEASRVEPRFNSNRYGRPDYCQLSDDCAEEITGGADDESEMGAFHDLFQPQKATNLRARLDEYTPAGMDAGIIFIN